MSFPPHERNGGSNRSLTPLELWSLVAAMILNLFTYWWANMAALPGLLLWPAAVLRSHSSTAYVTAAISVITRRRAVAGDVIEANPGADVGRGPRARRRLRCAGADRPRT